MPNTLQDSIFTFKVGGEAGDGIRSIGLTFSKIAVRSGYWTYDYTEYPSLIRGGHNVMQTGVATEPVFAPTQHTDFLIALNQETIERHKHELTEGAGVLCSTHLKVDPQTLPGHAHLFPIPLLDLVKQSGGKEIMRNTVAFGALLFLIDGSMEIFQQLITEVFIKKGQEVVDINHAVAQAGYDYAKEHFGDKKVSKLKPLQENQNSNQQPQPYTLDAKHSKMVIDANQAASYGAIAAGMQFCSVYPMTPTSGILNTLAPLQQKYNFIYKQPEDEIAAINMALGAAHAGARVMTATSGGGFCLMSEAYGLAGITELPIVIIEGMRGAPATGLPTWNEQGDLRFVIHAHQGDFPRIVLVAGDAQETFYLTMQAFNLADKYQCPVVVMVDKHICENHQSYPPFTYDNYQVDRGHFTREKQTTYERFGDTETGISLRSTPGTGNHFIANGDEHNRHGYSSEEIEDRLEQFNKRMRKIDTCRKQDMQPPQLFGPEEAEVTIVSWGSNKGAILEAMKYLPTVNFVHLTWMFPFPAEAVKKRLEKASYLLDIECNFSAELAGYIREQTGIEILDTLLRYDGRPIYPEQIIEKIQQIMTGHVG